LEASIGRRNVLRRVMAPLAKKRRRPKLGPRGPVSVRCDDDFLAAVDRWRRTVPDRPSRAAAIRQLAELALASKAKSAGIGRKAGGGTQNVAASADIAARQIDRMQDPRATSKEKEERKRRLLHGPNEFRHIRTRVTKG
jgi:hypothetical protein